MTLASTLRLLAVAAAVSLGIACAQDDPCQDYIDYMCDCHADDPDFDCEEIRITYEKANADLQDECVIELDKQQVEDEEDTAFHCDA